MPTATIEEYLDRLEEIVECAPTMPFTGKCVLDRKEISGLVAAMRGALISGQSQTKVYPMVNTETFPSLGEATKKGLAKPEEDLESPFESVSAVKIVEKTDETQAPVRDALAEAARIIEEAKTEAQKIRAGADEYAENALAGVEQNALSAARAARKGLDILLRRRSAGN